MESELSEFRRRKQLEQKKEEIKVKVNGYFDSFFNYLYRALLPNPTSEEVPEDDDHETETDEFHQELTDDNSLTHHSPKLKYLQWALMFLTWILFYVAFLKVEFGAVFFAVSLLIFIYYNTRTTRRKKGEVSAYSVFNKECEAIHGTLKPEDLEKSLLYRA